MDAEMDVYDIQVTSNFRVGEIKRRKNTKMKAGRDTADARILRLNDLIKLMLS